jgi:nucleoside-diphosphate-sugar epimerase
MNIVILGCGYIGTKLAKHFSNKGHFITTTTHNQKKLEELSKISQKSLILKGTEEGEMSLLLEENKSILLTVAADKLEDFEDAYLKTAQTIKQAAINTDQNLMLIYTSRALVYGDHNGKWVDENSDLLGQSDQAKILIETENVLQSLNKLGWKTCIFRLSEVYGPGRELESKLVNILPAESNFYTNMIHIDDVIAAIDYAYEHRLVGIYNLADDDHPTRKELYDAICSKLKVPKIDWKSDYQMISEGNRRISNHKIKSTGYNFIHPKRKL